MKNLPLLGNVPGKPHNPNIKPCDFYISPGGRSAGKTYIQEKIHTLEQENDLLKQNIAEVVEYIENNMQYDDNIDDYWVTTKELLEILKGSDK